MASEPVRLTLIGAGRMGQVHLGALRESAEIELAGVVEPATEIRRTLGAEGIPAYETVEEMLDRDRPDGVLIAAPSDQHQTLVERFAAAGLPMLCEKPLGVRVEQARLAGQAADAAGVLLQVGYLRRFLPELRALRERIQAGELGQMIQLSSMQWDHELPSERFRAHSGGISVDMGVHEFDQTRWLLGQEFRWLAATAAGSNTAEREPFDPDCALILAKLSGQAAATISLGRHFPHADSCWLEVWGTAGYTRVPFMWDTAVDALVRECTRRQAEAFARAVRGAPCEGARAADAVAALAAAGMAAGALVKSADSTDRASPRPSQVT